MGQVLHGSARTTEAIRRAIQHSQASLRDLAKRYGINQKTVAKWRRRSSVSDADGAKRTKIDRADGRRRGHHRGLPPAYAAAVGRLPLFLAGHHPASDAVKPAP